MDFLVIVLGGDMNSYGLARAFYEKYHKKTIILGKYPIFPTANSKLTEGYYYEDILETEVFLKALKELDKKYPKTKKFLFGNMDFYVEHIMKHRKQIERISDNYIIPMVDLEMFQELFCKERFYQLCDKYSLNYPKYQIFDFSKDDIENYKVDFEYPIFIKPSDTVIYADYVFEGKQKGYKVESKEELYSFINKIKESGFNDRFIFQEYIEGDDESMFVFTAYVSSKHEVQVMTTGKILMHDRTPELIGNYSAITNAYEKEFSLQLKAFLEKINFTGICHFDVQYDIKRKKFYVFEMNIRQGRSNLYTLASGVNLIEYVIDDYIYNKKKDFYIANKEFTVSILPKCLLKYCLSKNNQKVKIENFSRFALVKYDLNLSRCIKQLKWDYRIVKGYLRYND